MTNLETLPARMDRLESQIVQLRAEMHDGFSAVRGQLGTTKEELRTEFRTALGETKEELRTEFRTALGETEQALRDEIRAGDEESRRLMRVLHEDVVGRLALLQEGRSGRKSRRRRNS